MARAKQYKTKPAATLSRDQALHFYHQMLKIRLFEEQVNQLYLGAKMPGLAHLYIGQEAVAEGVYEVMNMASLWQLPVIYVCENNQYNEYTSYRETTAGEVTARAAAFGIQSETIDGQDVNVVHSTSIKLVERARRGEGPAFLQCNTYRFHGH